MILTDLLQKLIEENRVEAVLCEGSGAVEEIKILQKILYEIGFGAKLEWETYGADGNYGKRTRKAVRAFALRNSLPEDGTRISRLMAAKIISRYETIDDLRCLKSYVEQEKVEIRLFNGSTFKAGVAALQTILNELGFGDKLNWQKYGADGDYGAGTARAVKAYARQCGLDAGDGDRADPYLVKKIVAEFARFYGFDWSEARTKTSSETPDRITIREAVENSRTRIYLADQEGSVRFTRFKKGVYFYGRQLVSDFISRYKSELLGVGLTYSALNVILAVSENEGMLDAINTWDNAFLSFGMFQWTLGVGAEKGELPSLLKKINKVDPEIFDHYFGRHGLACDESTGQVYGSFMLDDTPLDSETVKGQLRDPLWAFRFWKAGQDPIVQQIQVAHAISRLDRFYWRTSIQGSPLSELVTSEYGVCLLLDTHVNRPAYLKPCAERAMAQAELPGDAASWSNAEEEKFLEQFLEIRQTYGHTPMTNAAQRGKAIAKYLDRGVISEERGSFQYS